MDKLKALIIENRKLKNNLNDLLELLLEIAYQDMNSNWRADANEKRFDSNQISVYADVLRVLAEYDRIEIIQDTGCRQVIAKPKCVVEHENSSSENSNLKGYF